MILRSIELLCGKRLDREKHTRFTFIISFHGHLFQGIYINGEAVVDGEQRVGRCEWRKTWRIEKDRHTFEVRIFGFVF